MKTRDSASVDVPNRRKKSGPISGATLKRQGKEGKSGKAMLVFPQSGTLGLKKSSIDEEG
jgi:hypothetical protein